ncbi:hypothetical protein HYPSUDRAFT_877106 [Hypholoma sublateritium FD-334 SS-4]|uniref:Uncharacterized protein n=1 Tax=Hypholoma sublateritium (strain FD-334 SS-4) TaxID=945553 RepID=A0A0D2PA73_HYPSF|nr:hypothetical protein HYPSUDRAFT_877106 [Hypholoma sublateritium FD-334 SS-4]
MVLPSPYAKRTLYLTRSKRLYDSGLHFRRCLAEMRTANIISVCQVFKHPRTSKNSKRVLGGTDHSSLRTRLGESIMSSLQLILGQPLLQFHFQLDEHGTGVESEGLELNSRRRSAGYLCYLARITMRQCVRAKSERQMSVSFGRFGDRT